MKENIARFFRENATMLCMLGVMLLGYVLLHDLLGGTLFYASDWDSYSLQAMAWRNGHTWLDENYPWLELAVYDGHYFVSFPPVPSLVMLPLTFLFGSATPSNIVVMLYGLITTGIAYKLLRRRGVADAASAATAVFYVWGSNALMLSLNGGVWFQAQMLSLLLLTAAISAAFNGKRLLPYALVALAVGCRPLTACAFLPLMVHFWRKDRAAGASLKGCLLMQLRALIIPALIAAAYMAYNYVRFDNPLEFGHNYLPEFTESEHGQFSIVYLGENLYNLFFRGVSFTGLGQLDFPHFNGFWFYIANPIFLVMAAQLVRNLRNRGLALKERFEPTRIALIAAMALVIIGLCLHKTLGGIQFGARYTVDIIPLALAYIIYNKKPAWGPKRFDYTLMAAGVLFNIYGALYMIPLLTGG